jgi:hypothetical protein
MIQTAQGAIKPLVMIEDSARAINIERGAELLGHTGQIDILPVKFPIAVMKRMHVGAALVANAETIYQTHAAASASTN